MVKCRFGPNEIATIRERRWYSSNAPLAKLLNDTSYDVPTQAADPELWIADFACNLYRGRVVEHKRRASKDRRGVDY